MIRGPKTAPGPVVLTIAGLDPSGGAGIIADVSTFTAFGCNPAAVITSITFQNSSQIFGVRHQSAETVRSQILPLLEASSIACVKTGMLPTREIVVEVAHLARSHTLSCLVIDPVMRSTSGYDLIDDEAVVALKTELLPLARVVTPNIPEAERLAGISIRDVADMRRAAALIRELGARSVLVKGGHWERQEAGSGRQEAGGRRQEAGSGRQEAGGRWQEAEDGTFKTGQKPDVFEAVDVLDDEGRVSMFRGEWIADVEFHGSGCVLSAALAACLANRKTLEESVLTAKEFVAEAMRRSLSGGPGVRPLFKVFAQRENP